MNDTNVARNLPEASILVPISFSRENMTVRLGTTLGVLSGMDLTANVEEAHEKQWNHRSVLHVDSTATDVYNICCIILGVHLSCGATGFTSLTLLSLPILCLIITDLLLA